MVEDMITRIEKSRKGFPISESLEHQPLLWEWVPGGCIYNVVLGNLSYDQSRYGPCNQPGRKFRNPNHPEEKVRFTYCSTHEEWGRGSGLVLVD